MRPLGPQEALKTFELPAGYRLEVVASEPMIEEPAALAWDGNGRMYVAEMRSYMQDIDGTGSFERVSRISLLDDTDGDGRMDAHSVFVDGLVLPRMILTLEDSIVVQETNTLDLQEYRDTDGDGVADQRTEVFEGGPRSGNLEHQPSGLLWNIDNYVYLTYESWRYRWKSGAIELCPMPAGDGQWGLTHDDVGTLFYSRAGGEIPAASFQQNLQYGPLELAGQLAPGFTEVWPIDDIPDVQGGRQRLREDNTLNFFTACCGQVIYRGDRLPGELYGDLFIPEPVGRLIRRAQVTMENGVRTLRNACEKSEFIRSTDANFRPVNMYTGPDGALYIVDMYRGIIQEGNWVREGSFLRDVVLDYGLDRNIGRGRIYRLVHEGQPPGPRPRMLEESSAELVGHLSHRNGWWRDTAQKLLVLRADRSVAPALRELARSADGALTRLHALWTLDGLCELDRPVLLAALADGDARLRCAAVRLCEGPLSRDAGDPDPSVPLQVVRTASYAAFDGHSELILAIRDAHPDDAGIRGTVAAWEERVAEAAARAERLATRKREQAELHAAIDRGRQVYQMLCFTCHGTDGRGTLVPGQEIRLAPSLVGSPRVRGSIERAARILLQGMAGPIDGTTYPGAMVSMASNDDQWVADVLTFVRSSWDNGASRVQPAEIAAIRATSGDRTSPWTEPELRQFDPALRSRSLWKLTASHRSHDLHQAVDGSADTRWGTGDRQTPGAWLRIELPYAVRIDALDLDTRGSENDYPRRYEIRVSDDGEHWGEPVARGEGSAESSLIPLDAVTTRFVEIRQVGTTDVNHWSVHELYLHGEDNPVPEK